MSETSSIPFDRDFSPRRARGKVLIFAGCNLCRSPRSWKEATTLAEVGYNVTVLGLSLGAQFDELDRDLLSGTAVAQTLIHQEKRTRTGRLSSRALTWLARKSLRHLRIETAAALGPTRSLVAEALRLPADLTIAHTEIPLWATRRLIEARRQVAVDLEDWYSEDLLPGDQRSRPLRLLRKAEAYALHYATYVSTTSQSLATALTQRYGGTPPCVIRNTFPLPDVSRLDRTDVTGPPSFVWISQTTGPGRGLEQFLTAWGRAAGESRVVLVGAERPGYAAELLRLVPSAKRTAVQFVQTVRPAELPLFLTQFDVGLALEPHVPANKNLTTSNKLFHYLAAGLGVIATDTAGQSEVLRSAADSAVLLSMKDGEDVVRQLSALVADAPRRRRMQEAARAAAQTEFNWTRDANTLRDRVEAALASSGSHT